MVDTKIITIVQNSVKTTCLFRLSYIKEMLNDGYKVYLIAIDDCENSKLTLENLGVKLSLISNKSGLIKRIIAFNSCILKAFLLRRLGFIQCHFISTFIYSFLALSFHSKKTTLVIEGMGTAFYKNKRRQRILSYFMRSLPFKRVFMNESERDILGIPSDLVLYGIGVDLSEFGVEKLQLSTRPVFTLAYFGRLVKDKGVLDCIRISERLIEMGFTFKFNIYGEIYEGNPSSLLQSDIDKLMSQYEGIIEFKGYSHDVINDMSKCDMVVLPSKCEGFPVVVMEASCIGIPSIVYDVPGCRDAISQNVNGYIFNYQDINAISELIMSYSKVSLEDKKSNTYRCIDYAKVNFNRRDKDLILSRVVLA